MDQGELDRSLSDIAGYLQEQGINVAKVRVNKELFSKIVAVVVEYVNKTFHLVGELAKEKTFLLLQKLFDRFGYTMTITEREFVAGFVARFHEIGEKQLEISSPAPPPGYEASAKAPKKKNFLKRLFSRKPKAPKTA